MLQSISAVCTDQRRVAEPVDKVQSDEGPEDENPVKAQRLMSAEQLAALALGTPLTMVHYHRNMRN